MFIVIGLHEGFAAQEERNILEPDQRLPNISLLMELSNLITFCIYKHPAPLELKRPKNKITQPVMDWVIELLAEDAGRLTCVDVRRVCWRQPAGRHC